MGELAGIPFFEVPFNKKAAIDDEGGVQALKNHLAQGQTTDLIVISHGWNNHIEEARDLYTRFFESFAQQAQKENLASGRRFAALGVLWPSKKFADSSLIPGGAAGVDDDVLTEQLEALKGGFDARGADSKLEQAKRLVDRLETDPEARRKFGELVRGLVPKTEKEPDGAKAHRFFEGDTATLVEEAAAPLQSSAAVDADSGGIAAVGSPGAADAGGAAGIGDMFGAMKDGALNLLNYATYYQMKERAGLVGRNGLFPLLRDLRAAFPMLKIHLIGHSFGGRLVTAAASGAKGEPLAETMTLLQSAFSHHGFASQFDGSREGFFRQVIANGNVRGPIIVTCTTNDIAVGKLYPLASLFAGQDAAGIGGPESRFGGLGCNGAQKTPEAVNGTLFDEDGTYAFERGKIHNLKADQFIKGHSDVAGMQVARAVASAIATT
jgi:hypothetical protein